MGKSKRKQFIDLAKKGGMIKEGMHKMPSGKKMKNSAMKKNKK